MLKTEAILEIEKNGRIYQLHLPNDAPLGEAHDVLYQMRTYVIDRIQEHMKKEVPVSIEAPQEVPKEG